MKKRLLFLILTLAFAVILSLASCAPVCTSHVDDDSDGFCDVCDAQMPVTPGPAPDVDNPPDLTGISFPNGTRFYNGEAHSLFIMGDLPSGVTVQYEGNGVTDAGAYDVVASFYYKGREIIDSELCAKLHIEKATFDPSSLALKSSVGAYNGAPHTLALDASLPYGVVALYSYSLDNGVLVDSIVSVGGYKVLVAFDYNENNYNGISPLVFDYTVEKGEYDMTGVTIEAESKAYDSTPLEASISSLPSGLSAELTFKNALGETVSEIVNVGTYTVTAAFKGDLENYNSVADITSTVTIERATISGISLENGTFYYDGSPKSIFVTGAPEFVEVEYQGNEVSSLGIHRVAVTFPENANYYPISPLNATITIRVDTSNPTSDIEYVEYGNGYAVNGVLSDVKILVVPETYRNKPVLSVASYAFDGNETLEYVHLPTCIVNVGNRAFSNCPSLATVEFGNVEVIGQQAFRNTAIKVVSLPASLESIGFGAFMDTDIERIILPFVGGSRHSSSAYLGFIFGGSTYAANSDKVPESLTTIEISNGCTEIPPRAFYGLTSVKEIILGDSVKKIGNSAFEGCSSLRDIYIPASITEIPANFKAENSPFFGTAPDMMIVVESSAAIGKWGQYFGHISDDSAAIIIYNKTYDDYLLNKDSYRVKDAADPTITGIYIDGELLSGFDPSIYEYTLEADVNHALPELSVIPTVAGVSVSIEKASSTNGNVATIRVVSINGEHTLVYKISFNIGGDFESSCEIVNKGGAKGTVSFILDDGFIPTTTFMQSLLEKYSRLSVTYAVSTKAFVLDNSDEYDTIDGLIVDDIDGDGMLEYVLDENGKYTYVRNDEAIDFWRDVLSTGRNEIVAHSHTHAFMGVNDEGGAQLVASTSGAIGTRIYSSLPEGSLTKEVYASVQIIKDLFGDLTRGISYVNGGIPPKPTDTIVTEEVNVYVSKQTVRVLYDTPVTVRDGKVYLNGVTWVNLQSTVGTLPADTDVITTCDTSSGIIPADTPIYLASGYITIPTLDNNGNTNIVKGFKASVDELYKKALQDGTFIGARTSGRVVYTASDFLDINNRILRRAYIIATSTNEARPQEWKDHINDAIAADGGWASFCIHAITDDIAEEGQGAHKITKDQAVDLFEYALSKGDDLWIATQTDATLYYHQWSTSTVTHTYDNESETITVSLTDKENDEFYNMPLTVKVNVPSNWAHASLNGEELAIKTDSNGRCFVYVDVAPESTVEVIGG